MRITYLKLNDVPPFRSETEMTFPKLTSTNGRSADVHLFTGVNGTGKSRLLCNLAVATAAEKGWIMFGPYPEGLLATYQNAGGGVADARIHSREGLILGFASLEELAGNGLSFAFGPDSRLEQSHISLLAGHKEPEPAERLSFGKWNTQPLNQHITNLKIQAAVELMNGGEENSGRWIKIIRKLESAISSITGKPFSVIATAHPNVSLSFQWGKVRLPIEGLPSGLNSILAWVLAAATTCDLHFPDSPNPLAEPMVFFLDEVEAWLHPEWQIKVLPLATSLFPNSQFFVASHSPFVVCSMNEGYIYRLDETDDGVIINPGEPAPKGDSYMLALHKFLGFDKLFDLENEDLLKRFRTEREGALGGDKEAEGRLKELSNEISSRGPELANIIGMEMRQYEKLIAAAR